MNESQREALVLDFVRRLKHAGSWCGETHIQKATYFLQEFMGVPLEFNFIFYKHGPFSFDLSDQLTALQGNQLVELRSHAPYGPHLHASASAQDYLSLFSKTIARYQADMDFIVEKLASKNVAELERISTALYVRGELPSEDRSARARRMNELKPHVSFQEALSALAELAEFESDRNTVMS